MIRKTSIKKDTTDSSSIYKKKEENNASTSTPLTHVSLVNKSGILNKVLNTPKVKYDSEPVGCHEHVTAYYDYEWRMLYC